MELRTLLAFGSGVGIEIREHDLAVTLTHVRPKGVRVAASTVIHNFRVRPAGEWGSEYLRFLREHGGSHLAATVVAPKQEVIVRQMEQYFFGEGAAPPPDYVTPEKAS